MSKPLWRESAPLVTRCRSRTVANDDSITVPLAQVHPVLGGEAEEGGSSA